MKRLLLLLVFLFALAAPISAQDSVSTANVNTLIFRGRSSAPSLSTSTQAVIYFDTASGNLKISEAGGAYANIGGGGTPGGADTQVQFNDAGAYGGDAGLTYNKTTNFLTVTGGGITLSSSTINKITITAPATGATFTLADGKTLTVSNTLTFSGTDTSSIAFGAGGTVVYTSNNLSAFAATTSAQLAGVISDETGTGLVVFSSSPAVETPKITTGINDANGNSLIAVTATGSAIFGATLANAASGGTVAWGVTAPTQAASGIAGTPVSFRASNAVAGNVNAGAVAGGAITFTTGDAARLTSGTALGGNLNIVLGSGIGGGAGGEAGKVLISSAATANLSPGLIIRSGSGVVDTPFLQINSNGSSPDVSFIAETSNSSTIVTNGGAIIGTSSNHPLVFATNGLTSTTVKWAILAAGGLNAISGAELGWSSSSTSPVTAADTGFARNAAAIIEANNGTAGQWGSLKLGVRDAGTTTIGNGLTVGRQSTGTPDVGLGSAIQFNINSSTTADQNAGQLHFLWTDATHATRTADFVVMNVLSAAAQAETFRVKANALIVQPQTITAGGTTGNQTINKPAGTVNFAVGTSTLTVTNSLVTASSQVFAVVRTNDATADIKNVVPGAGSFVITLNAAVTEETSVGFWVINQ